MITRVNPAMHEVFRCGGTRVIGRDFRDFIGREDALKLTALIADSILSGARHRDQSRTVTIIVKSL